MSNRRIDLGLKCEGTEASRKTDLTEDDLSRVSGGLTNGKHINAAILVIRKAASGKDE